jgi:hypothetical protein
MTAVPQLSVVIPTLGRPILVQTLDSLIAIRDVVAMEILVVGSIADPAVAQALADRIRMNPGLFRHFDVSFPRGDSSEKKNLGAREARADIVAFVDDDVKVDPEWPRYILEPFHDPAVGLVSGPSLTPDDVTLAARLAGSALSSWAAGYVAERYSHAGETRRVKWSRLIGCNMAYRKTVLMAIGGFDPGFWPGEEMKAAFLATQAGQFLVFQPLARLYHYPRQSFVLFMRQVYGYGATRIRLMRAGVEPELAALVPLVILLALAGWLAAGWFSPLVMKAGLIGAALYLLGAALAAILRWRDTRVGADLLIFFFIPLMHISYGLGELMELVRPGKDFGHAAHGRK